VILLDTNVVLRHARRTDPAHTLVNAVVRHLLAGGQLLCVVPQNIYEFWVVATRPVANNGLGLSVAECDADIADILATFQFLPDSAAVYTEWLALVRAHGCQGKVAHDARFVAAMRTHGVTSLLTFNVADFARYPGLTLLDPNAVTASIPPASTP
jgi:predicted nucleic acid-binding protein